MMDEHKERKGRDILEKFSKDRRWLPKNFSEKAKIVNIQFFTVRREIERYISLEKRGKSVEVSDAKFDDTLSELRSDFSERDNHGPEIYEKSVDQYFVPNSHQVGTCTSCDGNTVIDCKRCSTKGIVKCPSCKGQGKIRKKIDCLKCGGSGTVGDESCTECQGDGKEITREACLDCNREGVVACTKCDGDGEYTCPKCAGEGQTHKFRIHIRQYSPNETVKYGNSEIPLHLVKDIRGTHIKTKSYPDKGDTLLHEIETREIPVTKVEYKFPQRIIGRNNKSWCLYDIDGEYRCLEYPSRLHLLY